MAKGRKPSASNKGSKGRKNHGPKRHIHRDVRPKALQIFYGQAGVLSKYDSFDSFCVALSDRGVRADYKLLWEDYRSVKTPDFDYANPQASFKAIRAVQREWFTNVAERAVELMRKEKTQSRK